MTTPVEGIRVLIVDDELPARQRLADLLTRDSDVGLMFEAGGGRAAVEVIRHQRPDVVLLDVQMPELNGLEVVEMVGPGEMPLTVFVTAYDQHAIRAFEANALDYLLKPFSDERFEAMMSRVKKGVHDLQLLQFGQNVARMIARQSTAEGYRDRLAVKMEGVTRLLLVRDIDWIEAAGVYVTLHVAGKASLHRSSLTDLEQTLDPAQFLRIHRTVLVNIDSVLQFEPLSHGELELLLRDGSHSKVSRTYRASFERRIGENRSGSKMGGDRGD